LHSIAPDNLFKLDDGLSRALMITLRSTTERQCSSGQKVPVGPVIRKPITSDFYAGNHRETRCLRTGFMSVQNVKKRVYHHWRAIVDEKEKEM
jgi:hypothetical protein